MLAYETGRESAPGIGIAVRGKRIFKPAGRIGIQIPGLKQAAENQAFEGYSL
jgi:hypothetical protein